jgi:putative oxidoreductase
VRETRLTPDRRMSTIAEWALRLLLTLVFVYAGIEKFPSAPGSPWIGIFANIGFGQWFRYFTGTVEVIGGCLLLLPRATPLAVAALVCTMIGAIVVHLTVVGVGPQTVAVVILITALIGLWLLHRGNSRTLLESAL